MVCICVYGATSALAMLTLTFGLIYTHQHLLVLIIAHQYSSNKRFCGERDRTNINFSPTILYRTGYEWDSIHIYCRDPLNSLHEFIFRRFNILTRHARAHASRVQRLQFKSITNVTYANSSSKQNLLRVVIRSIMHLEDRHYKKLLTERLTASQKPS